MIEEPCDFCDKKMDVRDLFRVAVEETEDYFRNPVAHRCRECKENNITITTDKRKVKKWTEKLNIDEIREEVVIREYFRNRWKGHKRKLKK